MESLVKDLLDYTKVNQLERPLEPVDANDILSSALGNLGGAIIESGAQITSENLPGVRMHGTKQEVMHVVEILDRAYAKG